MVQELARKNIISILPEGGTTNLPTMKIEQPLTSKDIVNSSEADYHFFIQLEKQGVYLNKDQIEAVRHGDGPALVIAGAGAGKTSVLISRTGYLIQQMKISPYHILLVTFTKKAAEEMEDRISILTGIQPSRNGLTIGTFHSIFLKLLRAKGFNQTILSNEKYKHTAMKMILKGSGVARDMEPETLLSLLSHYKSHDKKVGDLPERTSTEKEIKRVLIQYEKWKSEQNYMDFDDILELSLDLLQQDETILQQMRARFTHILCDEFQDTNPVQYELIKLLAEPTKNLFVVGDDDQTIYSFNGANQEHLLNFHRDFPGCNVKKLTINYRSSNHILTLGNEIIQNNTYRHQKKLKAIREAVEKPLFLRPDTTDEEAEWVLDQIRSDVKFKGKEYRDFAILYRTASNSRSMFEQFVLKEIPFSTYQTQELFYQQSTIKIALDYLRLSLYPKNLEALRNILPTLYVNREKAFSYISDSQRRNPIDYPLEHLLNWEGIREFQRFKLKERISLINSLSIYSPLNGIKKIREFYDRYLEADEVKVSTIHQETLKEMLAELESSAKRFGTVAELLSFVDHLIEKHQTLIKNQNGEGVQLLTIHKSKGLEFKTVFLIGASEKILPHSSALDINNRTDLVIEKKKELKQQLLAIEEERRLAYVAVTRAIDELYISSPKVYRGEKLEVSRFFREPFRGGDNVSNLKNGTKSSTSTNLSTDKAIVWDCQNMECIGWKRITDEVTSPTCALCHSSMVKKERMIRSRI
ncbi:hypothetical protein Q73_06285 [Bacillus coahuilensis m2-6]|uniref:UvrD-helicase domain-containing protein n=1 Tax=Bacillus coahuilensis TaxID=408580 RepID=UPI00075052A8|nr:UvrD-helicase domain-containing protein [Bacillus coahuilensis]KUP08351.1 hypothetical protein Q73_06285 [Bacillus coahuilensis m2-6]